jgi:hypothetical protein
MKCLKSSLTGRITNWNSSVIEGWEFKGLGFVESPDSREGGSQGLDFRRFQRHFYCTGKLANLGEFLATKTTNERYD